MRVHEKERKQTRLELMKESYIMGFFTGVGVTMLVYGFFKMLKFWGAI